MLKLKQDIKIEIEDKYIDKISIDKETNLLICRFTTKEEIELFKKEQKIKFKQSNLDTEKGIELENKRISSVLNLRNNLHDIDLPKEYYDKLGIMNAKVIIIESGYNQNGNYREGTAVHISACHSEIGNSLEHINNINNFFATPNNLKIFISNREGLSKPIYIFINKYNEKKLYYAFVDKNEDNFELFDIYFKKNKEFNNDIKNYRILELK